MKFKLIFAFLYLSMFVAISCSSESEEDNYCRAGYKDCEPSQYCNTSDGQTGADGEIIGYCDPADPCKNNSECGLGFVCRDDYCKPGLRTADDSDPKQDDKDSPVIVDDSGTAPDADLSQDLKPNDEDSGKADDDFVQVESEEVVSDEDAEVDSDLLIPDEDTVSTPDADEVLTDSSSDEDSPIDEDFAALDSDVQVDEDSAESDEDVAIVKIFEETFEGPNASSEWTLDTGATSWEIGVPAINDNLGRVNVLGTNLGNSESVGALYQPDADIYAKSKNISIGAGTAKLRFHALVHTPGDFNDYLIVKVKKDSDPNWESAAEVAMTAADPAVHAEQIDPNSPTHIGAYSSIKFDYFLYEAELTGFENSTVQLGFYFHSDSSIQVYGIYIDDILIYE